jgi:hypothetical protein
MVGETALAGRLQCPLYAFALVLVIPYAIAQAALAFSELQKTTKNKSGPSSVANFTDFADRLQPNTSSSYTKIA